MEKTKVQNKANKVVTEKKAVSKAPVYEINKRRGGWVLYHNAGKLSKTELDKAIKDGIVRIKQ